MRTAADAVFATKPTIPVLLLVRRMTLRRWRIVRDVVVYKLVYVHVVVGEGRVDRASYHDDPNAGLLYTVRH